MGKTIRDYNRGYYRKTPTHRQRSMEESVILDEFPEYEMNFRHKNRIRSFHETYPDAWAIEKYISEWANQHWSWKMKDKGKKKPEKRKRFNKKEFLESIRESHEKWYDHITDLRCLSPFLEFQDFKPGFLIFRGKNDERISDYL